MGAQDFKGFLPGWFDSSFDGGKEFPRRLKAARKSQNRDLKRMGSSPMDVAMKDGWSQSLRESIKPDTRTRRLLSARQPMQNLNPWGDAGCMAHPWRGYRAASKSPWCEAWHYRPYCALMVLRRVKRTRVEGLRYLDLETSKLCKSGKILKNSHRVRPISTGSRPSRKRCWLLSIGTSSLKEHSVENRLTARNGLGTTV